MNNEDKTILAGLMLTSIEAKEDIDRREQKVLDDIARDMRDVVPCTIEIFGDTLASRYHLDKENDADLDTYLRIMDRVVRYEDETNEKAHFLVKVNWATTPSTAQVIAIQD